MDTAAIVERSRWGGVLWRGYVAAARNLVCLAVPGIVVFVPVGALTLLGALPLTGSVAVVNDEIAVVDDPGTGMTLWWAALVIGSAVAQTLVFAATLILAAGQQTGAHIAPSAALRAALRRWPALLVLVVIVLLAFLAVAAVGFGVRLATDQVWLAYIVMAPFAVAALPMLLAGPALVLERRSPLGSIGRAYALGVEGTWPDLVALTCGVLILPVLAARALAWALPHVPDALAAFASGTAGAVLALLTIPFQASVLTRMFLQRLAWRSYETARAEAAQPETARAETARAGTPWAETAQAGTAQAGTARAGPAQGGIEGVIDALPENPPDAPAPARTRLVVAALLLPGLLHGATALINPFGWLEVRQDTLSADWRTGGPLAGKLSPRDLRTAYAGRDARLVLLIEGWQDPAKLLTCSDASCGESHLVVAEPADANPWPVTASTPLPDGRLVLTTWRMLGGVFGEAWLGLLICDPKGCVRAPAREPIAKVRVGAQESAVALAARPGGGLVVAHARDVPAKESTVTGTETVTFTICADPVCSVPVTKQVARLDIGAHLLGENGFVLAVTPDGRPVAAQVDDTSGTIYVISCQDPACDRPQVARPAAGKPRQDDSLPVIGLAMGMRADGRPVIAYQDVNDGSVTLLDCRTPDCAQGDTVKLAGAVNGPPALVVDRAGRTLVAYQDEGGRRIAVARCAGTRCATVAVSRAPHGFGERVTMTLDGRGRPVIAWIDYGVASDWGMVVTTPLNLR
ncbi:hypothetical protein [Nonomuraea insulae]|uniref:Uncharacterized protein n=1 Tax=Nonomuraea insulae TaxID=1616787 RepID=A0ABW1D835_9ACTN